MNPILKSAFRYTLLLLLMTAAAATVKAQTPAPPNAVVYFINLKNGDRVTSPFKIQFGLSGMGVAPAGVEKANTGHHHLLIDTTLTPEQFREPDARTRASHPATRARRLVARPIQSADRVAGDHGRCEVRIGERKWRLKGQA